MNMYRLTRLDRSTGGTQNKKLKSGSRIGYYEYADTSTQAKAQFVIKYTVRPQDVEVKLAKTDVWVPAFFGVKK